jgi:hypothetical protein
MIQLSDSACIAGFVDRDDIAFLRVADDLQNELRCADWHDLVGAPVFGENGGGEQRSDKGGGVSWKVVEISSRRMAS